MVGAAPRDHLPGKRPVRRTIPIGMRALAGVLVPAVLPLIALAAIRIPLEDVLPMILKTLL